MKKLVLLLLLTGCASPVEKIANTQWPEVVLPVQRQQAVDLVVAEFSSGSTTIQDVSPSIVQIRMPADDPWLEAWYSCTICPDPYVHINMLLSDDMNGTRVVSQYWFIAPTYQGGENRVNLDGNGELFNKMQHRLWDMRSIVTVR